MMHDQLKKKNFIFLLAIWIFITFGAGIRFFADPPLFSYEERRTLQSFPDISITSLLSTEFMKDLEIHIADTFPFRTFLQESKGRISSTIFRKKDLDGYYFTQGHLSKMEYPLQEKQVRFTAEKIAEIQEEVLEGMTVYYGIIPDKNYYLANDSTYLSMDYDKLQEIFAHTLSDLTEIDLVSSLEIEDYYHTDPHWKQENLQEVLNTMGKVMGFEVSRASDLVLKERDFYGAFFQPMGYDLPKDALHYILSDAIHQSQLTTVDTGEKGLIYDPKADLKMDPYNFFLGGPAAIQIIENTKGQTNQELILFRDSFGSSLAPLLIDYYDRITLVDLRYVPAKSLEEFINFEDQDVLFLYSTLLINNGGLLR